MCFGQKLKLMTIVAVAVVLAGCSEVNLLSYGAKTFAGDDAVKPAPVVTNNTGVDRGTAKIGKPYQIDGIWYYPAEDLTYDETGIASWYGEPFHGRKTANGAVYDMNKMTAAHKTLPLPTDVRVTNLENGRSVIVTVNDRGPFAHSRIIDLSKNPPSFWELYKREPPRYGSRLSIVTEMRWLLQIHRLLPSQSPR